MTHTADPDHLLPFDAWACLSARMLRRDSETRARTLAEAGFGEELWACCDARWTAELVRDLERRDYTRLARYGRECAAELARRPEGGPAPPGQDATRTSADFADTVSLNDAGSAHDPLQLVTEDAVTFDDAALPFKGGCPAEFVARLPPLRPARSAHPGDDTVELRVFDAGQPVLPFGRTRESR